MTPAAGDAVIRPENMEFARGKTRFLQKLAAGSFLRRLALFEESAREAPFPEMRFDAPAGQENFRILYHHQAGRGIGIDINDMAAPGAHRAATALSLRHLDRRAANGAIVVFGKFQFHECNIREKE